MTHITWYMVIKIIILLFMKHKEQKQSCGKTVGMLPGDLWLKAF